MANSNFLPAGTVIKSSGNTYTIRQTLGSGGFGITYKAVYPTRHNNLHVKVEVAIKELFISSMCERSDTMMTSSKSVADRVECAKKDFIGEARRLGKLSGKHPNIVQVSEVFEDNGTAYYVMEFIEGENLDDFVKSHGPLSFERTMQMMSPIIDAVDFLHQNYMTHLDIKPGNIMLSYEDGGLLRPVLIDFGMSKHYNPDGSPTSVFNINGYTDGYAPVEQYVGITSFSPQSDVYSLAATIIFCLTGQKPCRAIEMNSQWIRNALEDKCPQEVIAVLEKAMQMKSADRQPNAGAFLAQLQSAGNITPDETQILEVNHEEIPPTPPVQGLVAEPAPPKKNRGSYRKWIIVVASFLVAAAIGMAAVYIVNNKKDDKAATRDDEEEAEDIRSTKATDYAYEATRYWGEDDGSISDDDLIAAANSGDPQAFGMYGWRLLNADRDEEAFNWFCEGYLKDDPLSTVGYVVCLIDGSGVGQDVDLATSVLDELCATGYPEAQYIKAFCYHNGIGVTADEGESKRLLELAAKQGLLNAIGILQSPTGWDDYSSEE